MTEQLLFSPVQTAEALGVSKWTVYALLRSRELPSVKIGSRRRVPVEALRAYIERATDSGYVA